jgi:hypothetical protein
MGVEVEAPTVVAAAPRSCVSEEGEARVWHGPDEPEEVRSGFGSSVITRQRWVRPGSDATEKEGMNASEEVMTMSRQWRARWRRERCG